LSAFSFNGSRAEQEFRRQVLPLLSAGQQQITTVRLPSTSPAMARLNFEQKLLEWSQVADTCRP
jgi:G:T/U-mismatch repair DNA glycosylase